MAESTDGAYKTGQVWQHRPFRDLDDPQLATFRRVSWRNSKHLHQPLDRKTFEAIGTEYYTSQALQAAPL